MAPSFDYQYSYKGKIKEAVICSCGIPAEYHCRGWMYDHDRPSENGLYTKLVNKYTCEQCKDNIIDESEPFSIHVKKVFYFNINEFLFLANLLKYLEDEDLSELKELEADFTNKQGVTEDKKNFYTVNFLRESGGGFRFIPIGCLARIKESYVGNDGLVLEKNMARKFKTKRIAKNAVKRMGLNSRHIEFIAPII